MCSDGAGGTRAGEGTTMPSGGRGGGSSHLPCSEPRSRAQPEGAAPTALCGCASAPGREMVTCPLHRQGGAVRSAAVVSRLTGRRQAPAACTPALAHCRVHACACVRVCARVCVIRGMGPGVRCEGGWLGGCRSGSEHLKCKPRLAGLSVTRVYYLRSSQFQGTFVQMKLISSRRKIAVA